ncbi:uncharacterized protein L969DRAFT_54447, partial [Mixia osmundae IAM 14324]|uniref:uncharacterized protein n=1 Tax=Mixia osmundae (strain CBS 9802 / IAM 14324 / JCM 22182 / KY 12970) TaxID=764103 RepID=UPI0004A54DDC
ASDRSCEARQVIPSAYFASIPTKIGKQRSCSDGFVYRAYLIRSDVHVWSS